MRQELRALKKMLKNKEKSQAQLAVALGYRSAATIAHWFQKDEIPSSAKERVRKYLERYDHDRR